MKNHNSDCLGGDGINGKVARGILGGNGNGKCSMIKIHILVKTSQSTISIYTFHNMEKKRTVNKY